MRLLSLSLLLAATLLTSCASSRPAPTQALAPTPVAVTPVPADSTARPVLVAPAPVPGRRLLGLLPAKVHPAPTAQSLAGAVPRKCKGCTFNVVAGDQQLTGKKATTAGTGATALGSTHGQTVTGDGNTITASVAAASAGGLLSKIRRTLGDVLTCVVLFGLLLLLLLFLFRKRLGFPF